MLTNCVSTVCRCRGILLLVVLVSLLAQLHAEDGGCKTQSVPVSGSILGQIPPPRDGVTVTYYDDATVWVGLNHAYADSQSLTHRWRSFIPWMSSSIVSVFPFSSALQSPATRMPLFYVSHIAAALDASEPGAKWVHLVRADTKHNARVVQITSGWSAFSFHPGFTAREDIPLRFHVLSSAVYTIQPERPLDNGEYFVIFGPSALSGFEFQIACSGAPRD
jgi:hypothetical protein